MIPAAPPIHPTLNRRPQDGPEGPLTWGLEPEVIGRFHGHPISLAAFQGPLDLLLYLVDEQKIDIHDIPISLITSQYLEYLSLAEALEIEVAAEFVVTAATLLWIKSRSLLPAPPPLEGEEEGPDPALELAARLEEYRRFRDAANALGAMADEQVGVYARGDGDGAGFVLDGVSAEDLFAVFRQVLARARPGPPARIPGQRFTLREKIAELWHRVASITEGIAFHRLFDNDVTRVEVIVTFLALLELIRLGRLSVRQRALFGEIVIYANQSTREPVS